MNRNKAKPVDQGNSATAVTAPTPRGRLPNSLGTSEPEGGK